MTQEDKELLLKDLCARSPYGVYISPVDCGKSILIGVKDGNPLLWDTIQKKEYDKPWDIEYVKPYLRPMSSMTKEEKWEYSNLCFEEDREEFVFGEWATKTYYHDTIESIDWLNTHHFDYRGLIERGLAIEAPEGIYNLKEK